MRRLDELTTSDLDDGRRLVLAVPVGSCEQHGAHLPLGTDTIVATELARRLAARRMDVVVGPALGVTASGEHAGFPGTLSIGTDATATVLVELARSAGWAAGVVLVNGHGGNADAVERATTAIRGEGRNVLAWWPHVSGGDAHAGRTETSLLLAIRADLVDLEAAAPGDTRPLAEIAEVLRLDGIRAVTRGGVLGDPTAATLEQGAHLLNMLTADLVAAVDAALRTWPD